MIGDERGVKPLLRRLPVETGLKQMVIIWALGAIASKKALEPLLRIVWGKHSQTKAVARWSVAQILHHRTIDRTEIRERYLKMHVFAAAKVSPLRSFPLLTPWEDKPTRMITPATQNVLRRVLIQQLGHQDRVNQVVLLHSLVGAGGQLVIGDLAPNEAIPKSWIPELAQVVASQLRARNPALRAAAIRFLGFSGQSIVPELLVTALSDPEGPVRIQAIRAIRRFPSAERINELLDASVKGPLLASWQERAAFAETIGALRLSDAEGKAIQKLVFLLADAYPTVRIAACKALEAYGPYARKQAKAVQPLLGDSDPLVVIAALNTLGALKNPQAGKSIRRLIRAKNPHTRQAALAALEQINN
jgi:HEAT repeat protein